MTESGGTAATECHRRPTVRLTRDGDDMPVPRQRHRAAGVASGRGTVAGTAAGSGQLELECVSGLSECTDSDGGASESGFAAVPVVDS